MAIRVGKCIRIAIWFLGPFVTAPVIAQVVTDGTVVCSLTFNSQVLTIPQDLGTRLGDNLFHSFQTFDIQPFYDGLGNSDSIKVDALRQAQLAVLQNPEYQHPFYWASFVLIGSCL